MSARVRATLGAALLAAAPLCGLAQDNAARCAAIATAQELSAFTGQPFVHGVDPIGENAVLLCYYTARSGPGSRVIRFEIRDDPDRSQYRFGRQLVDRSEDVGGLGERAYASTSAAVDMKGGRYVTHRLTAWRGGRLYSASLDEYGSAQATRAQLRRIVERLLAMN